MRDVRRSHKIKRSTAKTVYESVLSAPKKALNATSQAVFLYTTQTKQSFYRVAFKITHTRKRNLT